MPLVSTPKFVYGVPQDSVFGLLLFTIFIYNIFDIVNYIITSYADDNTRTIWTLIWTM